MAEDPVADPDGLSFSDLGDHAWGMVQRACATRQPLAIREGDQVTAVIIGVEEFNLQQRRLVLLERIARSREDFARGRVHSQDEIEALVDGWSDPAE